VNAFVKRTWADGIRAVHEEAAGVLTMLVIRQSEALELMTDALQGDAEAARLLTLISKTAKRIDVAKRTRSPMLCVSCPRPLLDTKFAFVVAGPAGSDAVNHIAVAVCRKCGRSTADITRKATAGLRRLWPDLRPISVHPTAGHA